MIPLTQMIHPDKPPLDGKIMLGHVKSTLWRKARNFTLVALAAASALLLFSTGHEIFVPFLTVSLAVVFALSAQASRAERREFTSMLESQKSLTDELLRKKEASDNNTQMTQEIGRILTGQKSIPDVLSEVARILEKRLDYDRGGILIVDKERGILETKHMFGYSQVDIEILNNGILSLEATDMLPVKCFRERKAFLVNYLDEDPGDPGTATNTARILGTKALICCPIVCAEEVMGVVAVDNTTMKRVLLQSDVDLLMHVGQEIGVTIKNLALKQTEKALRESEALFRAVVEKSAEVLLLTNVEGRILYVSPPVTEGFAYSPADLIGREARELVYEEDAHTIAEAMLWVRQNPGKSKNATLRIRHGDGSLRWVEVTMRNLLSEPGVGAIVSNLRDVTDRKQAQEALEESENKFKDLVEKAMVGVYLVQDGVFRYANAKCAEIHGYADPEQMNGLDIRGTIFPEDVPPIDKTAEWVRGEGQTQSKQFRIVRKNGEARHVETFGRYTTYRGKPAVIGMIVDATDRKNAEIALRWKTTFLEALVASSHDGILVLDSRLRTVLQNHRLVEMWKMPPDITETENEKRRIDFFMASVKNPGELSKKLTHLYNHPNDTARGEFGLKDGTVVEAFSYPVLSEDSMERYGRIWMFRDITELRRYWDMLENLSSTDGLTEISNRRRFDEFLEREWRRSMREHSVLSLLLIDIDYFKEFNDRYGHLSGDDCLRRVAAALRRTVRRAGDLVARYGGDEFVCILPGMGEKEAVELAQKIVDEIAGMNIPHESSTVAEHVTVSIGVGTAVPEKGRGHYDLIGRADQCLYSAKQQGRKRVVAPPVGIGPHHHVSPGA